MDTSSKNKAFTGAQVSSHAELGAFRIVFDASLKEH